MIIVNAILYLSSARYSILSFNELFVIEILPYLYIVKNFGNYRKHEIFLNFRFTWNMIFSLTVEIKENMIFELGKYSCSGFFTMKQKWKLQPTVIRFFTKEYRILKVVPKRLFIFPTNKYKIYLLSI